MIEIDLSSHLSTNVAQVAGRVYPLIRPQDSAVPSIVYTIVNDQDRQSISIGRYGFEMRVQIDVYAKSYASAKEIRDAVQSAMYTFGHYPNGFSARDLYESETMLFRQLIEFYVKG